MRGNRPTRNVNIQWSEARTLIALVPNNDGKGLVLQINVFSDGDVILSAMTADLADMEGKRPDDVMREAAMGLRVIAQGVGMRQAQDSARELAARFLAGETIAEITKG